MTSIGSLCVYCGSSNSVDERYLRDAFSLGRQLAQANIRLVYGGGRIGLMGQVADGVLAEGGFVTGIIPEHLHQAEVAHTSIQELLVVQNMHMRKQLMAERADAFAVLPGGFGTLDEMFEILTWRQLGLHNKEILLVDIDSYWLPLLTMIQRMIDQRFASARHANLYRLVQGVDAVVPALTDIAQRVKAVQTMRM